MFSTLAKLLSVLSIVGLLAVVISGSIFPLLAVAGAGYALVCVYQSLNG